MLDNDLGAAASGSKNQDENRDGEYIYLDPVGLQSFIDDLNNYAADVDDERATVQRVNSAEGDPSNISLSVGLGSTIAQRHADLESVASELQTRLDEAVAMNESGITPMDANGRVAYYLPEEGEGSEDTIENVQAYNSRSVENAKADATALAQARGSQDGVAADGRTVDEILDEMAKHQDVPAYGASFVNMYGIEQLIEEPLGLQWYYTSIDGPGATASGPPDTTTDQAALDQANGILGHIEPFSPGLRGRVLGSLGWCGKVGVLLVGARGAFRQHVSRPREPSPERGPACCPIVPPSTSP